MCAAQWLRSAFRGWSEHEAHLGFSALAACSPVHPALLADHPLSRAVGHANATADRPARRPQCRIANCGPNATLADFVPQTYRRDGSLQPRRVGFRSVPAHFLARPPTGPFVSAH